MTYTLINGSSAIRRDFDGACIPDDPRNIDWQAYQAWIAAGNTPAPSPAPSAPTTEVIGFVAFTKLFTAAEQQAIFDPAASWQVRLFVAQASSAGAALDLMDVDLVAGVNALVTLGLLTQARVTQILANQPPA